MPTPEMSVGKYSPRNASAIHSMSTEAPIPKARIRRGKISDSVTQVATLRKVCIEPTNATIRNSSTYGRAGLPTGSSMEQAPMSRWHRATSAKPMMNVLRLLKRSIIRSAMIAPMTEMPAGAMLAMSAAPDAKPAWVSTICP
jgi:hypothetical protein